MPTFVMDASVAIAGLSADENHRESRELVERAIVDGATVPALWAYEVANILALKARRGTLSAVNVALALGLVREFRLDVESFDPRAAAYAAAFELAGMHRLTVYDAAYLEIARRRGLPLATLDARLKDAAGIANVATI